MPTDVIMPQMGESIFEGTLTKWLKKPGDKVNRDEPLFEISTDKVDAEIPSPASGVLKEVKVQEGQTVQVNTVVGVIDEAGSAAATPSKPAQAAPSKPTPAETAGSTKGGAAATEGPATTKPVHGGATREAAQAAAPPKAQAQPDGATTREPVRKSEAPATAEAAPTTSGGPGTDVIMPQMGESIFEGTITKWLKKPGEKVTRDEPLFEISTDKVDAEIPSPATGVLSEIKVSEGQTVQVNTVVAVIGGVAGAAAPAKPAASVAAPPAEHPRAAAVGDVRRGEAARAGGDVTAQREGEEETEISTSLRQRADVEPGAKAKEGEAVAQQKDQVIEFPSHDRDQEGRRIRSSPLVRRLAREHNVDLGNVPGTGLGGRITKEDMLGYIERGGPQRGAAPAARAAQPAPAPARPAAGAAAPAAPTGMIEIPGELVPMSAMRKKIAERMVESKRISAHVHSVFKVDVTRIDNIRKKQKAAFEQRNGVKLTYLPFVARAVMAGVRAMPVVNASVEGDAIRYHKHVNLGIAVALDWGLIVPVVKNAEELSFVGLARAFTDLGERARSKKLKPDEVQGGTFTITNPGIFGPQFGTPIIPQPQVAILGMGGVFREPAVITDDDGNEMIAIRSIIRLSLGYDHRIVDGADADRFMVAVKKYLEGWSEEIG